MESDLRKFALSRPPRIAYFVLLCSWAIALYHLDRFPVIHQDEPWILSPGFKLLSQGQYGSDFFSGFAGMQQHYLQFMPLMSLIEGLFTHFSGVDIFSLRVVPVSCAMVAIAFTYRLGRDLVSPLVGLVAVLLLMVWSWLPPGGRALGSGIPLVDLARIARYDILVAPLGLAALFLFLRAESRPGLALLSGIAAGLAGLAHLYGLFWLAALAGLWLFSRSRRWRTLGELALGALLAWLPWLLFVASNWQDYVAQSFPIRERYAVLDPSFYVSNLISEPQRYHLDPRLPGVWLLVAGVPLAWLAALWTARKNRRLLALVIPSILLPLLFALFIRQKTFNYLATLVPLCALLISFAASRLSQFRPGRWLVIGLLLLVGASGMFGLVQMQSIAGRTPRPETFLAELHAAIPRKARVMGHPQYALPFLTGEYRSFLLLFQLSEPESNRAPISFYAALEEIDPRYILYDPAIDGLMSDPRYSKAYHAFMLAHRARLMRVIYDQEQTPIRVYRLQP